MTQKEMWQAYCEYENIKKDTPYDAFAFCGGGKIGDELAELVLCGKKRATASWYDSYICEGEALPSADGISMVLYDNGDAACIIKNTSVAVVPFYSVTERHARLEGEGDLSLGYWRDVHTKVFSDECAEEGIEFLPDHSVVLEEFECVFPKK